MLEPQFVKIPDVASTALQKSYLREYADAMYPKVDLIRMDRNLTVVDPLYLESPARRFLPPISIRCLPDHEPAKKILTKYGMDQTREVLFQVCTMHLADIQYLQNNETWMIGDLVKWGGDVYEIKQMAKATEGYWAETNIPMFYILGADYYRAGI